MHVFDIPRFWVLLCFGFWPLLKGASRVDMCCIDACDQIRKHVPVRPPVAVRMHVCMHVCMYICMPCGCKNLHLKSSAEPCLTPTKRQSWLGGRLGCLGYFQWRLNRPQAGGISKLQRFLKVSPLCYTAAVCQPLTEAAFFFFGRGSDRLRRASRQHAELGYRATLRRAKVLSSL